MSDLTTAAQWILLHRNLYTGTIDGDFGPRTRDAVVAFQRQQFPTQPSQWDGVIGPNTWSRLDNFVTFNGSSADWYYFKSPVADGAFRLRRTGASAGNWYTIVRETCSSGGSYVLMDSTRNCG